MVVGVLAALAWVGFVIRKGTFHTSGEELDTSFVSGYAMFYGANRVMVDVNSLRHLPLRGCYVSC